MFLPAQQLCRVSVFQFITNYHRTYNTLISQRTCSMSHIHPIIHHSEQKCAYFCSGWCIVGCGKSLLWDFNGRHKDFYQLVQIMILAIFLYIAYYIALHTVCIWWNLHSFEWHFYPSGTGGHWFYSTSGICEIGQFHVGLDWGYSKSHGCQKRFEHNPNSKVHGGQHGAHLGPFGPDGPHEPCYQGKDLVFEILAFVERVTYPWSNAIAIPTKNIPE